MREFPVKQRSEAWEILRLRPTSSNFHRIVTPVRGEYSTQSDAYALELLLKKHGLWIEHEPTYEMLWGEANEKHAIATYEQINKVVTREAGFVTPDETEAFGCSPDRFVDPDGGVEAKCPMLHTLAKWHLEAKREPRKRPYPQKFKPQIQGHLLCTGRKWWDFFAWHPSYEPLQYRVYPDHRYQQTMVKGIERFLQEMAKIAETFCPREIPFPHTDPDQVEAC